MEKHTRTQAHLRAHKRTSGARRRNTVAASVKPTGMATVPAGEKKLNYKLSSSARILVWRAVKDLALL